MTVLLPFWIGIAAVLMMAAFLLPARTETDSWQRIINPRVLAFLRPVEGKRRTLNLALLAAGLTALALAGPARPARDDSAFVNAENWFLLVDVSRSMALGDIAPRRIASARDAALALIERSESRPAALILYAGDAYLAAPPSFDKTQLRSLVQAAEPGVIPIEGSDTARALALTASIIGDAGLVASRIFILSDGDARAAGAEPVAAALARDGHRVDVLVLAGETGERPADRAVSQALAAAGNGTTLLADPLGRLDIKTLAESRIGTAGNGLIALPLASDRLDLLSHWLLLPVLPILLVLYRRQS